MAAALRGAALKGSALCGAAALGLAYYQRVPRQLGDHRTGWAESRASRFYQSFVVPLVLKVDPETAHVLTLRAARVWQEARLLAEPSWTGATPVDWLLRPGASAPVSSGPTLNQELFGGRLRFGSPFGIAAGFDKNADLVPLYRLGAFPGLGFSEVGSVSAEPAAGNEQPRCLRLPEDGAIINRMGLNNLGSAAVAARLERFAPLGRAAADAAAGLPPRAPVGVNIAKTHDASILGEAAEEDFATSFATLQPLADFVVLNVSCPNTAEGRTFEEGEPLSALLCRIARLRKEATDPPPVLVKLSPQADSEEGRRQLRELVKVAQTSGAVDGFVVSNTVGDLDVPLSAAGRQAAGEIGPGGLSGRPLRDRSTAAIREVYRCTDGRVPIIGVGGVDSPEAAYEKIRAGASLVEVYTGFVYKGPWLFSDLHVGLRRLLARDGYGSVSEAVGADVRGSA